jgi:hypothetical protein
MSTEQSQGAPAGAAESGQTAELEQRNAGVAQPQGDDGEAGDQSQGSGDQDKGLTDEQKTIRKMQRRIDRLTAKRGGTERENEILRQHLESAHRQLQAAGRQGDEEGEGGQGRPQSRQLTDADIDRIASERAQELHQRSAVGQRLDAVVMAGRKLEGFDDAVDAVAEIVPFADRQGRPTPFIEAVLDCDDPAAVLKHLGDNPDEAEDFADLTPAQLGRRLAKLEDKLKQGAKKQTSAAPAPLRPVNSSASSLEPDPEKDASAWIRARNKQQATRA